MQLNDIENDVRALRYDQPRRPTFTPIAPARTYTAAPSLPPITSTSGVNWTPFVVFAVVTVGAFLLLKILTTRGTHAD
jgi:hypothetical protein